MIDSAPFLIQVILKNSLIFGLLNDSNIVHLLENNFIKDYEFVFNNQKFILDSSFCPGLKFIDNIETREIELEFSNKISQQSIDSLFYNKSFPKDKCWIKSKNKLVESVRIVYNINDKYYWFTIIWQNSKCSLHITSEYSKDMPIIPDNKLCENSNKVSLIGRVINYSLVEKYNEENLRNLTNLELFYKLETYKQKYSYLNNSFNYRNFSTDTIIHVYSHLNLLKNKEIYIPNTRGTSEIIKLNGVFLDKNIFYCCSFENN
ncbi:MAG: hypothetical protein HOP11_11870 [Saprospiraceae bacterium]|nr:hypothetical protein [Saprospiraceae bacterium]